MLRSSVKVSLSSNVHIQLAIWTILFLILSSCSELTPQHIQQHIKRLISDQYNLYVINLGTTINDNPLQAYVISGIKKKQQQINQLSQIPAALITSYMHPRQPYSIKLMETLLNQVLNNYQTDFFFKYMLDNTLLILFPFVNIDGYIRYAELKQRNSDIKQLEMYRKNLNKYGNCKNQWDYGVDINRNFDTAFGTISTSKLECSEEYRGPQPFSQKQSKAIKKLYKKFKITLAIDIHSYGNQWIYPYASQKSQQKLIRHRLYPFYKQLIKDFKEINKPLKNCYETLGYIADGVYIDWALDQGALSLAVQIGKNFDNDININAQILQQVQQTFHTVLKKQSISYKKYISKQGYLMIQSTSLIDFQIGFYPNAQKMGFKRLLQSGQRISFTQIQNPISGSLKVGGQIIEEEIDFQKIPHINISSFQPIKAQKSELKQSMLSTFLVVFSILFLGYCALRNFVKDFKKKTQFRLPGSSQQLSFRPSKSLDRDQISPFGRGQDDQIEETNNH